ncbi:MAG: enoyl-CoA hydratase-related protein [Alphaproteobacteria bacterium]
MAQDGLHLDQRDGSAWLTMARPAHHNAMDDTMIVSMTRLLERLAQDPTVERLVLAAEGKSFSAGADLSWMRRTAAYSEAENLADARTLSKLMRTLDEFPKPTIARIHGATYGGGVGLVACCDIAIASSQAVFCISEVKLGLIPSAISPFLIAAIGARAARRYVLTTELFDADVAHQIGLVHEVVAPEALDAALDAVIAGLAQGGPQALEAAKRLIRDVSRATRDEKLYEDTAQRIASTRAGWEGREGVTAFLEKRPPSWRVT